MSKNPNEERLATLAFILDRVEQLPASCSAHTFISDLVGALAEGRHIEGARAGEYDAVAWQVQLLMWQRAKS